MEFNIVSFSKGPLEFSAEEWKSLKDKHSVEIDIKCNLRYKKDSPFIGIQFDIRVNAENTIFLKTGFLFGVAIPELPEVLKETDTLESRRDIIEELLCFIWPGVIGVTAAQTAEFNVKPFILPDIYTEELAKEVILTLS